MAQQTAVEWLINHWKKLQSEGEKMSWQQIIDITELAKQIEKEQAIKKTCTTIPPPSKSAISIKNGNRVFE